MTDAAISVLPFARQAVQGLTGLICKAEAIVTGRRVA